MGTYCELYIADFPVLSEKSQANPIVMTLFREVDKVIERRQLRDRNPINWSHALEKWDPQETEAVVEYRASVTAVKTRLRAMGFTWAHVERDFARVKEAHLLDLRRSAEDYPDLYRDEIALLSTMTLADFLQAFRDILASGMHPVHILKQLPTASPLVCYMMEDHEDRFVWRFPCSDLRCFIRALLEVVPGSATVTQDLTDLVDGEYYSANAAVTELGRQELKGDYSINSPVIILAEGTTDTECIRAALNLLYPELAEYYAFMDLAARTPGGAGSLVHVVKSFVGAGIENRIVALFDNDTAGHAAISLLQFLRLPQTIRVLPYPDIDLARSYPTVGPTGASVLDVNGSACSVELYFGRDVLAGGGNLMPVQWRAYDDKMKRYQGEVIGKDTLKTAFLAKVAAAQTNRDLFAKQDWADMRKLLDAIIDAFNT